jgi:hypothetical protein
MNLSTRQALSLIFWWSMCNGAPSASSNEEGSVEEDVTDIQQHSSEVSELLAIYIQLHKSKGCQVWGQLGALKSASASIYDPHHEIYYTNICAAKNTTI